MKYLNSQALILIFCAYFHIISSLGILWIAFFSLVHMCIVFLILSTLMYLYRKKHNSFYFSLTNVTNNFHKRQRQKKHILNSLFMLFYYCGQNIYSFYSYKHFMHKLWINHNIPTDLSTKLSTIVKNSTIMPAFRVIHNIHKVFHNYAILCGLMFIIIFTNVYYSSTCYSLMFITLSLYFILI